MSQDPPSRQSVASPSLQRFWRRLITGELRGPLPTAGRALLSAVSVGYHLTVQLRNRLYDIGIFKSHKLHVPVISVGNLLVGGSGKTPMVIHLAEQLLRLGRRPAVLLRGYGRRRGGKSDEQMLLEQKLQGCRVIADPDRITAAEAALRAGCDCIILDDGFQHRRLRRDLDILMPNPPGAVLKLLPRGELREPLTNAGRADVRVRRINKTPTRLLAGTQTLPIQSLRGRKLLAFCGIGRPEGFFRMLTQLGGTCVAAAAYDDHCVYTHAMLQKLLQHARDCRAEAAVTTIKDWVKIARLGWPGNEELPLWVLDIELEVDEHSRQLINQRLEQLFAHR